MVRPRSGTSSSTLPGAAGISRSRRRHEKCYTGPLRGLGGGGGTIAVDGSGRVAMDFSTEGMFRGARDSEGRREVAIH